MPVPQPLREGPGEPAHLPPRHPSPHLPAWESRQIPGVWRGPGTLSSSSAEQPLRVAG